MEKETLVQMTNCAICPNMCRFDCPVTSAVKREGVSPSAKMRLGLMLEKGMLEATPSSVANLYQCAGCRGCEPWCPFSGLSVPDMLDEIKIGYTMRGLAPSAVYEVKAELEAAGTLYRSSGLKDLPALGDKNPEVLLFAGCAYRAHRPQAVRAAFNLLKEAAVKVTVLDDETCCGFPAGCQGLMATTARVAGTTREKIKSSGVSVLVTACPECYSAFSQRYPAAGMDLGLRVVHLTQYLRELIAEGRLGAFAPLEGHAVWHDPCVLGRGLKIYEEPRSLLAGLPGLELEEARYHRELAHCCGAGQLYERIEPEAAREIASGRAQELEKTKADFIITSCPFCEDMLGRAANLPVVDLAEVLWAGRDPVRGKDFLLQARAEGALKADAELRDLEIQVQVDQGLIKLEGEADSWGQVVRAGQKVGSLPGVYSVVNNLHSAGGWPVAKTTIPAVDHGVVEEADVVIIGGGVVGCSIARELSRYQLKVVLLEKDSDVCCGTSKANNGMVHPGIFVETGTLKARLNVRGVELYPQAARELDFPLNMCGLIGVVTRREEMFLLELIKAQAAANGVSEVEILSREEVLAREPHITPRALGGFFAPRAGMTSPYKVTVAYAENALTNGVRFYLDTPVTGLQVEAGRITRVLTPRGSFPCRYVVNAAGLYADQVAAMAGEPEFTLHPRKGELLLFDNKYRQLFTSCLAEVTLNIDPHTKGGGMMMTVDGNVEMGPTAEEVPDREDLATSRAGLNRVLDKFDGLVEGVDRRSLIAYFAGLRAATYTEDFHIAPSRRARGLINVAGIQSPGLAAAPAIAEYVLGLLKEQGLTLKERPDFNPIRKDLTHFKQLDRSEQNRLILRDRRYGNVVCRCETITEGEIVEAIHRPLPATNLDAIKRRTRAGMGRCQGGFCTPRVARILARETGVALEEVTKNGAGSWMFASREGGV